MPTLAPGRDESTLPVIPTQKKSTFRVSARSLAAALTALLLVLVGIGLAQYAVWYTRQSAAAELARLLRSDRPEVRLAAAEQLKDLGRDGIAPLVQALLDERQPVFALACDAIDQSLASWQFLPPDESDLNRATLAQQLRQVIDQLPAERRFAARRWAEHIAVERFASRSIDAAETLANCEAVLRSSPVQTAIDLPPRTSAVANATPTPARPSAVDLSTTEPNAYRDGSEPAQVEPEIVVAQPDDPPFPTVEVEPAPLEPTEPQRLATPAAQPIAPRPLTLTRKRSPRQSEELDERPIDFSSLADLEVMRWLHASSADVAEEAEEELRERGYRAIDLPLCRALTHPAPAIRRQLVESLPKMQGINARPWLLQLAQDSNAEVREAAEGILAASGNRPPTRKLR